MSSTNIYCTYLVSYFGDKLPQKDTKSNNPPFLYFGSSSVKRVTEGYLGSVSSKRYKLIWKEETKNHPENFDIQIISYSDTRREATYKELQLQKMFNVVKNPDFVNLSYAAVNGYFGKPQSGIPLSIDHRNNISIGLQGRPAPNKNKKLSKIICTQISKSLTGRKLTESHKLQISKSHKRTPMTEENKKLNSKQMSKANSIKFLSIISTKNSYSKANAARYFPDLKHYF